MHPLELSAGSLQRALDLTCRFIQEEIDTLENQPSADIEGAEELARTFVEPPPQTGGSLEEVLERLRPAIRKTFNTAGPGYLAFIPGGGIMSAAIADFIATSTNRYVGVRAPSPALAQIEETAVGLERNDIRLVRFVILWVPASRRLVETKADGLHSDHTHPRIAESSASTSSFG